MASSLRQPDSNPSSVQRLDLGGDAVSQEDSTRAIPPSVQLPPVVQGVGNDAEKTVISNRPPPNGPVPRGMSSSHSLGQMLVGQSLDHYRLEEFVGGGGMGAVFRATDASLGRTVAVKVLSRDHTDEETIRRFRNEAQSAARLDHPNIARVYYVGEAEGWNYIVFEYIQGVNARDLVQRDGPLPVEDALRYMLKMAAAIDHASQRDVVHRDIKPSNILVTDDGQVKLVDMGLARLHQVSAPSDELTASGVTLGTFDYISPEQARDPRTADVRSDIYSLGCTLYFLLCGQPPFADGTALQKLLRHNGDDPPDMRQFRPDLPASVVRMVEKMLAKRPTQRQQTASELSREILAIAAEQGWTAFEAAMPLASLPSRDTRNWWAALAIASPVAVLLAAVLLVDVLLPQSPAVAESPFAPRLRPASSRVVPPAVEPPSVNALVSPPIETIDEIPSRTVDREPRGERLPSNGGRTSDNGASETPVDPVKGNGKEPASPASSEAPTTDPTTSAGSSRPKSLTRVIVRPGENRPEIGVVGQLATAVKLAADRGITEIELQVQGPLVERSLEITSPSLVIRAAEGFQPVILFRPAVGSLADEQRLIRIAGGGVGRITWRGVEFRAELPALSSSYGWSLFALQQVHTLAFEDCLLTMVNQAPGGGPLHYPVAAFTLLPPRMADVMMETNRPPMAPTTSLQLTRTSLRGEMAVVQMTEELPVEFLWKQGVLAISEAVLQSAGATSKPKWYGQIDCRWEHVSAFARGGFYSLQRRDDASHQFALDIRCEHCQLAWGKDAAWFDFHHGPQLDELRLQYDGLDNVYVRETQTFLRVKSKNEPRVEYDLKQRGEWSSERRPHYVLPNLEEQLSDRPLHTWDRSRFGDTEIAGEMMGADASLFRPFWLPTANLPQPMATNNVDTSGG